MGIRGSVDLGNKSAEQVEKAASGIDAGWYRALVADVYEDDHTNLKLVFELPDGRRHTETLWDPNASEKPQRLQQRRDAFSIRLGLVPRDAKGTAFEFDWLDAIGREVVVNLGKKQNDKGQFFTQLEWMGLYAADDLRVQEQVKGQLRLTVDSEASVSGPAPSTPAKQSSFSLDDL